MAGGSFTSDGVTKERAQQYKGRVTPYVIIACIVAATGGSLFGYDVGISGSSINITSGFLIFHVKVVSKSMLCMKIKMTLVIMNGY